MVVDSLEETLERESFSLREEEVERFTLLTGDPNDLHNAEYMRERDAKPYVPGLHTLSHTVKDMLNDNPGLLTADFENAAFPGQTLAIYHQQPSFSLMREDQPVLTGEYKPETSNQLWGYNPVDSEPRNFEVDPEILHQFAQLLSQERNQATDFLYTVSRASQAISEKIRNPQNTSEEEIQALIEKEQLPAYTAVKLNMLSGLRELDQRSELTYAVQGRRQGERDFRFDVQAQNGDAHLFKGIYSLTMLPKKILLRTAQRA